MPPAPQMTSNVYSQESSGEIRTLRGLSGTSRYSTAGASFVSAVRAVLQYNADARNTPMGAVQGLSWTRCGGVRAVLRLGVSQLLSRPERGFVCGYYESIQSRSTFAHGQTALISHICRFAKCGDDRQRRRSLRRTLSGFLPLQNACTTHATPPQSCRTKPNPSSSR